MLSKDFVAKVSARFEEGLVRLSIWKNIEQSSRHLVVLAERDLSLQEQVIQAASPERQLKRGYSIIRNSASGAVVSKRAEIEVGEDVAIEFAEGRATAKIVN
jgi:exonuclease VII large subunit